MADDKRPFSLLIYELPRHIYIQDGTIEIDIKTDTLTALQCLSMLDTDDVPDSIKVSCVIETILAEGEEIPPDLYLDAFSAILDYLKGFPVEGGTKSREPVFSYSQDHAYVVAGFRQAYGMSLEDIFITIVDTTSEDDKKKGSRRGSKKVGRETTEDAVAAAMIENAKEKDQE